MRVHTVNNKKMFDLLVDKEKLVEEGRKISNKLEKVEATLNGLETQEKSITGKVVADPKLVAEGEALIKQMEELSEKVNKIGKKIEEQKLKEIPKDLITKHKKVLKEKDELERERNKIALKVQKVKDKVIPMIQAEARPILGKYEDIESAVCNGLNGVDISIYDSHEEWLNKWEKDHKKVEEKK